MSLFLQDLKKIAKNKVLRVALPESTDARILQAINKLLSDGLVASVFISEKRSKFLERARASKCDVILASQPKIVCIGEDLKISRDEVFSFLKESLKNKPLMDSVLFELADSPLYQAGYLLAKGQVDCALAGVIYTTADVIRAAIRTAGKAEGAETVSGSFIMQRADEIYVYADCGVIIEPKLEELVDIALESHKTWMAIPSLRQREARIAFLSFSTKGSAKHKLTRKMADAADMLKERDATLVVDGEIQFDAAIDPEICARKAPDSPVAGKASIFVFPDLEAANIAYKITQRLAGFNAYGPLLQGLAKPYSDLSRGATVTDIVECTYINLLRALNL